MKGYLWGGVASTVFWVFLFIGAWDHVDGYTFTIMAVLVANLQLKFWSNTFKMYQHHKNQGTNKNDISNLH